MHEGQNLIAIFNQLQNDESQNRNKFTVLYECSNAASYTKQLLRVINSDDIKSIRIINLCVSSVSRHQVRLIVISLSMVHPVPANSRTQYFTNIFVFSLQRRADEFMMFYSSIFFQSKPTSPTYCVIANDERT